MSTVREATFELLRAHGMTTIFGNPGSTELPMLADYPEDFRYVLGLQEAVVVGMADGYAQASGTVGHANLHTAPGVGNGVGAIFNAQANHAPLLITAGQQVREAITYQANLTNRDAVEMPKPFVKWSYEPPRAADVPAAVARAIHTAALPPRGPAFVSIPMGDWQAEAAADGAARAIERRVDGRAGPAAGALTALADRLASASNPVLVAGPEIDASSGWDPAVTLAEDQRLPVWAIPATGGGRLGFPEGHPNFQGILPPAVGPISEALAGHDLILVVGASAFAYYPHVPGPLLPEGAELVLITSDPDEAARAPMGSAIVADPGLTLGGLIAALESGAGRDTEREPPPLRDAPVEVAAAEPGQPITGSEAMAALAAAFPADGIVVLEAPSATLALRNRLRLSRPGSYYFAAGGGLGFGLAAALGVQLAEPERPVVCVLGEGSAQYAITGLWTAAAYGIPVTFVVLNNSEYAILKWFSLAGGIEGAPGLDLPVLDAASVARGYGVPGEQVEGGAALREAIASGIESGKPNLVEVGVAPGMWLD